jgi:hypothetical protein
MSNITVLGLLSAYFPGGRGNPIIGDTPCKDVECHNKIGWAILTDFSITNPELHRRAGGGGRPDRVPDRSPNGSHSTHTDPNDQSGAGDQTGETEGSGGVLDTQGDLGHPEGESSNSGDGSANPDPNAQAANPVSNTQPGSNPAPQNANQYTPSTRNNHNQPAADGNDVARPQDALHLAIIDVDGRSTEFQRTIANKNLAGGPWYLYSGMDYGHKVKKDYRQALEYKLGLKGNKQVPYMDDLMPITGDGAYRQEYEKYKQRFQQ